MEFLNKIDKQQVQKITLIVIAALTILALVLLLVVIVASVNPASPFGVAGGINNTVDYTVNDKDLVTGSLVLADDDHPYDVSAESLDLLCSGGKVTADGQKYGCGDYRDEHLEKDDAGNPIKYYMNAKHSMQLTKECMANAHNMFVDAEKSVKLNQLFIKYCLGYLDASSTSEEYKTAMLVTMAGYDDNEEVVDFPSAYRNWFNENAAKYGFIESFEDSYRYVGKVHAKVISGDKNIKSLADYIAYLKENTNVGKTIEVEIEVDGVTATYKVYYTACKAGDTIKVPAEDYTISGTNEGGVIVTVEVK